MIETFRKISNNKYEYKKYSKQIINRNGLKLHEKVCKKNISTIFACSFSNKVFVHDSRLKRHEKAFDKLTFSFFFSKSYHQEDHFWKREKNCQNIGFSFNIIKRDDFRPRFIGESCFFSNRDYIVSNDPLDNSESITSLSENKNNGASLVFEKVKNDVSGNSLVESEVAIPSEAKWRKLKRIDRPVKVIQVILKILTLDEKL